MIIDSSGNIGIGDTTPDAILEILSTTTPQFIITEPDGVNDLRFSVDSNGTATINASGSEINFSDTIGLWSLACPTTAAAGEMQFYNTICAAPVR